MNIRVAFRRSTRRLMSTESNIVYQNFLQGRDCRGVLTTGRKRHRTDQDQPILVGGRGLADDVDYYLRTILNPPDGKSVIMDLGEVCVSTST